jgi:putative membrane protein
MFKVKRIDWYYVILVAVFLAVFIWSAINPVYPADWLTENYLTFIFVPLIIILGFYFRLSKLSYTLITLFMILHVIGSHYTYSEVPFGYVLQAWFNTNRNMYDRLVHLGFGLLLAYPIREVFVRITHSKGFWGYYLPLDVTLAMSAIYELIEFGSVSLVPQVSESFLGMQGDIWDAQKDMLMAGIGAVVSMGVTFFINMGLKKEFWKDFRYSFKIPKDDAPLGEVKIKEMLKRR